jgi:hypothetical protein
VGGPKRGAQAGKGFPFPGGLMHLNTVVTGNVLGQQLGRCLQQFNVNFAARDVIFHRGDFQHVINVQDFHML